MRKFIRSRILIAVVLSLMIFISADCGFILYPERRGNMPNDIDGAVLVMDCLWLIAGVVPGVVALVVDFTTGSIYFSGRGKGRNYRRYSDIRIRKDSLNVHSGDRIAFNLTGPAPANAEIDVTLAPESATHKAIVLLDRKYSRGETSTSMVMLSIPEKLVPGVYRIEVDVNGLESSSLDLNVTI